MTKAITKTYSVLNDNIRLISYMLLAGCLILISVYGISLFSIISKTVAMQKVEAKMTVLSSSVDELDSKYLSLSGKITPDNLSQYGMVKGKVSEYISRSATVRIGFSSDLNHVALVNER